MIVYLAGLDCTPNVLKRWDQPYKPYVLISYYHYWKYPKDDDIRWMWEKAADVMVDSGAFTVRERMSNAYDWETYIDSYAKFIVKNNIQNFYELDIDNIVGYDRVKEFRKQLENATGKKCIPVWHITRGKEDFLQMCDEYKYVALGGIVGNKSKDAAQAYRNCFPWFINEAHKRGAKIHGLGITGMDILKKAHFDSVDSTTWSTVWRYGRVTVFNGHKIVNIARPNNKKLKHYEVLGDLSFNEWVKFQKYALTNL